MERRGVIMKAWTHLRFIRITNCLGAAIACGIGSLVAFGSLIDVPIEAFYAMFIVFLATAGGMAANNYFDRRIDEDGAIARGEIEEGDAAILATVLLLLSLALMLISLPIPAIIVGIVNVVLLAVYTPCLATRGFMGNAAVAYLSASSFLFGGLAVVQNEVGISLIVLISLAFFSSLGREIIKDVEDIGKDGGARVTLPMRIGTKKAALVALISLAIAIIVSPVPYLLRVFGAYYMLAVSIPDVMFLWAGLRIYSSANMARISQDLIKKGMWMGMVAFLVGVLPF